MRASRALLALALFGCGPPDPPAGRGEAWPQADALFHRDARMVGADGAYSIDLGGGRVLWMFGDTFVARDPARPRRADAAFIRNSAALQTGLDPTSAYMRFYWRWEGREPRSFLPEPDAAHWYWPAHGVRLGGTLLLFCELLRQEGAPGPDSYANDGYAAFVIDDPDDEPSAWRLRPALLPDGPRQQLGEAVVREGDFVYAWATSGARHAISVARFAVADAELGDLRRPEAWCGDRWAVGCAPATLIGLGMPEFSVHHDAALGWVLVGTSGYGATALAWRTAPAPEGPWSDAGDVFRPVESFGANAFVYAGKAHPMLAGGGLVATYVPSSFDDLPEAFDERTYFPRFVRLFPR